MSGAMPPLPNTPSWRGTQLNHRDKFTFYLYYLSFILVRRCVIVSPYGVFCSQSACLQSCANFATEVREAWQDVLQFQEQMFYMRVYPKVSGQSR
jgi:hypothetical protein